MAAPPTGDQLQSLKAAILDAYDYSTLRQMVRFNLDADLQEIVSLIDSNLSDMVLDLILHYAVQQGGLHQLIDATHNFVPQNVRLTEVAREFLAIEFAPLTLGNRARFTPHPAINMAPAPPDDFVDRPGEYEALKDFLLADGDRAVAISAALRGAGGYGKTTLAQALCHDPDIVAAFPDGILWTTLGEHPGDVTGRLLGLVAILEPHRPRPGAQAGVDAAHAALVEALGDKRAILVIDDVWQQSDLEPFTAGGLKCTRLVTTRNDHTLPTNAQKIDVDAMRSHEAVALLDSALAVTDAGLLKVLAARLGEWPLLLKLTSGALHEHVNHGATMEVAIEAVNRDLDDFGLVAFDDPTDEENRQSAVNASISVSLKFLDEEEWLAYRKLAIFPADVDVPWDTLCRLWQMSLPETRRLCRRFGGLGLLRGVSDADRTIRLHDVIRTYLCEGWSEAELQAHNGTFLDDYGIKKWTELDKDEPYLWDQLAYHLLMAGRGETLRSLFADDGWLQVRVARNDYRYDGYIADLTMAREAAYRETAIQIDEQHLQNLLGDLFRYALVSSTINSHSGTYRPEFVARAVVIGLWTERRALSIAGLIPYTVDRVLLYRTLLETEGCLVAHRAETLDISLEAVRDIKGEEHRAEALTALAPHLKGRSKEAALEEGLEAALNIKGEEPRAKALTALAPQLRGGAKEEALEQALDAAQHIMPSEREHASVIVALAPQLSGRLLKRGLRAARYFFEPWNRAMALAAFASELSHAEIQEALEQGLQAGIREWYYLAEALTGLAPHLSGRLVDRALVATLDMDFEQDRTNALYALAPQLNDGQLDLARRAALEIEENLYRVRALAALAPFLSGAAKQDTLVQGLESVLDIENEEHRAWALGALAPYLSDELLEQGIDAALAFSDNEIRTAVLAVFAPKLNAEQLEHGLKITISVQDQCALATALAGLAPQLGNETREVALQQGLDATLEIGEVLYRTKALVALVPQLGGNLKEDVLEYILDLAFTLGDEGDRESILVELAPNLSGGLLERGLNAALNLHRDWSCASVLKELAPRLTSTLLDRGVDAAREMKDVSSRVIALAALAPHLSYKDKEEALQQVWEAVDSIDGDLEKAQARVSLAPYLSNAVEEEVLALGLKASWNMVDEEERAYAIARLAIHLSDDLLEQGLNGALAINNEFACVIALAALAPKLDARLMKNTLERTRDFGDVVVRAVALTAIADHSEDDSLTLQARQAIIDYLYFRCQNLALENVLASVNRSGIIRRPVVSVSILEDIAVAIPEICEDWRWL